MIETFNNDEKGYQAWIENNPDGFVIDSNPNPSTESLYLHTAACRTINPFRRKPKGRNAPKSYIKMCSKNRKDLENWAMRKLRITLKQCQICFKLTPAEASDTIPLKH
ncbi:MAG: hypothetical protein HQL03_05215 [Nitrospirae bacterium]|nr:hypothetical protein [Nitrospirota bacterium]